MSRREALVVGVMAWLCCLLPALGCGGPIMAPPHLGAEPGLPEPDRIAGVTAATAPFAPAAPPSPPVVTPIAVPEPLPAQPAEALTVFTDPGDLPQLQVAAAGEAKLPLEHTHVKARLTGFVAEVEVSQTYKNPYADPIEATYIFPLPENSAVHHLRMVIGDRIIEAKVKERGEARRLYDKAKQQGYTAALLEQERPNVFTQSVANIEPGKKIDVVIRYVQDLSYDAGLYEFVFPMVVGPRFMPGEKLAQPPSGAGTHADTDRVPDAARISPPIMGQGVRSGHDISLELTADGAFAVGGFEVPTHEVIARKPADGTLHLTLAEKESLPNRDFVLRYRLLGPEPKATLFTSPAGAQEGYYSLVLHPPALDVDQLVGRRELIFVVDVSGSMHGLPLAMCQAAMREALTMLRPVDTFNILTFAGETRRAFAAPRPANSSNIRRAFDVVRGLQAGGGTYMADAVQAALSADVEPGRHRYVFFLTDGYVGNEQEIIASSAAFVKALAARGQRARVFGYGVGSSVNRSLIQGLSDAGKGIAVFATAREHPGDAVNRFYHYIDSAVMTGITIQWGSMTQSEPYPAVIPDLFASHPVIIHGRYSGTAAGSIVVRGRVGDKDVAIPVTIRPAQALSKVRDVMGALWARAKVAALEQHLWEGPNEAAKGEITELGLKFHLVTPFTSLLAVDLSKKVSSGDPRQVVQPVERPEGVDVTMAGGVEAGHYGYDFADDPLTAGGFGPNDAVIRVRPGPVYREVRVPADEDLMVVNRRQGGCGCKVVPVPGSSSGLGGLALALLWLLLSGRARSRRLRTAAAGSCPRATRAACCRTGSDRCPNPSPSQGP